MKTTLVRLYYKNMQVDRRMAQEVFMKVRRHTQVTKYDCDIVTNTIALRLVGVHKDKETLDLVKREAGTTDVRYSK